LMWCVVVVRARPTTLPRLSEEWRVAGENNKQEVV